MVIDKADIAVPLRALVLNILINALPPHPLIFFFFTEFLKDGPAGSVKHEVKLVWPSCRYCYHSNIYQVYLRSFPPGSNCAVSSVRALWKSKVLDIVTMVLVTVF